MTTVISYRDEIVPGSAQRDLGIEEDFMDDLHGVGVGSDHTLCGQAYGEYVDGNRRGKITCGSCISAIIYHKSFKKGIDY